MLRRVLIYLLSVILLLPLGAMFLIGLSLFLRSMGDPGAAMALKWFALGFGVVWGLHLLALVVAVALQAIQSEREDR